MVGVDDVVMAAWFHGSDEGRSCPQPSVTWGWTAWIRISGIGCPGGTSMLSLTSTVILVVDDILELRYYEISYTQFYMQRRKRQVLQLFPGGYTLK